MKITEIVVAMSLLGPAVAACAEGGCRWNQLDDGLAWGECAFPAESSAAPLGLLRIDPRRYAFRLVSSTEYHTSLQTVPDWCRWDSAVAAFNAGMFQQDQRTGVGLFRNYGHVNNPRLNRYQAILAFNPLDPADPPLAIIDRECDNVDSLRMRYQSLVQCLRLLDCDGRSAWRPQDQRHSILALATDSGGDVLVIFSRAPISGYDFVQRTLSLGLHLKRMLYLEGGGTAGLYVKTTGFEKSLSGKLESFDASSDVTLEVPIPNVITVHKKAR